ncbi:hypothetical protein [Paenibacillus glacialis]|nr:hypothetical protein [Paenibacillus glacialis]
MKKSCTLTLLIFSIVFLFLSISNAEAATEAEKTQLNNNLVKIESADYYRQLYEDQKDYNEKILNTIYWALGGLATAIATVVGLNVFSSQRTNKVGMEAIKQEILKNNEEATNQSISEMKERFDNLKEQIFNEIIKKIDEKNEIFQAKTEILQAMIKDLDAKFQAQYRVMELEVEEKENSLRKEMKHIKVDTFENTSLIHSIKGVPENQVFFLCQAIDQALEIERYPESLLNELINTLSNMQKITHFTSTRISSISKKIPDNYDHFKSRLDQVIKEIKVD